MHADTFYRPPRQGQEPLAPALVMAIGLHVGIALFLLLASWFPMWKREIPAAGGAPAIEASLVVSAADVRAAELAMREAPKPLPQPVDEVEEVDTVPPPQPLPEPRPQDSPVAQQRQAQERIPVPDSVDQDAASRLAISQEKARQEQEAKRRQEQIDLTEQQRVEEAQKQQRLARQQETQRDTQLADIRRQRAQAASEAQQAESKLRELTAARSRQAPSAGPAAATAGNSGSNDKLSGQYAAAIQQAVLAQWIRPDSVPRGQRCRLTIRQLPGGEVVDVEVSPACPYDEAGRRSVEAAVL
ncbi:MAG: protein TolA, partial [Pseudoxanthomonas sp.]|nr:protein TolA [Pseudoxanthomonas sp.]